ncbi:unnamed protein product [Fusarium graminearum]|nr:unnamed protein product [Fusarium graminearum]
MKRPFQSTQTDYVALTGASETTPWLQHTRWAELFRDRPLGIIASTAKQPASQWSRNYLLGQWKGFPMWSSAETEAQLQIILHGLDLMFDRARATLDRTPYISRCWLNTFAKDAFWPHGFQVIPSFKRYLAIWKRFICFVFRVLQYPSWQRKEVYNLRLGSKEIKMMQHVLYLAVELQLGEDGHVSDSSDSEDDESCCQDCHYDWEIPPDSDNTDIDQDIDTSIDDAEELGEEQIPGSEESHFHLPNGYWLQLSEALFQLSMMFWTHQDPAGNMSSSAIIYYTAVMGIQQRSLTFNSAYNSTSELAGLMWIGRLLFLEYALPVYSYATLAYEWPCRDHYPSQPDRLDAIRKKYLIRGCYTPFGEIIELKAFAKSIVKREGIPGNLSWDPDGQSFTIGHDTTFKLSEFCATHCKAIKLVRERVDEMMLGLEMDIDIDEIQDDLTCRKAGWSFIQDAKNKLADTWERLADTLRSSSFRGKPFIKGTNWQVDTCIAYLNAGTELSKLTFAASHLSGGLPGRGTEIATIRYINTTLAVRNVFFRGGQIVIIISYNKARASNNYAFYIVRYLPRELSQSLLRYIAIIRPVLGFIAKQLEVPHWSKSEFFFPDPQGKNRHLTSTQASGILRSLTQNLTTPWTLSSYRQAALAIAKRYLSTLVEKSNFYHPTEATNPLRMFAAGAGHHPRMLLTSYAIDKALPSRLQPELLEMYYRLSKIWQDWNQEYNQRNMESVEPASRSQKRDKMDTGPEGLERQPKRSKKGHSTINKDTDKLGDSFIYNARHRIVICVSCGSMIQPGAKSFYSHLNSVHCITGSACKALLERFQTYELCPFDKLHIPTESVAQIPGLTVFKGFRCNICPETPRLSYFTISGNKIRDHLAVHNMDIAPILAEHLQRFQSCYLQTFSSAKGKIKYFEIQPSQNQG